MAPATGNLMADVAGKGDYMDEDHTTDTGHSV